MPIDDDGPAWPDVDAVAREVEIHEMVTSHEQETGSEDDN